MILNLFIFHQSGPCIFKREYVKGTEIDEQLMSGFLTALSSFAQEAFLDGLQRIHLASGRRLIYGYNKEFGILAAALADKRDHPSLVEEIVNQIVKEFIKRYNKHLKPFDPSLTVFEDFQSIVDSIILKRNRTRDKTTILFSVSLAVILGILASGFAGFVPESLLTLYLALIPSIPAGYVAGERKIGTLSGLIGTLPEILTLLTLGELDLFNVIFTFQLLIPLAAVAGALTGYYVERKFLYPL